MSKFKVGDRVRIVRKGKTEKKFSWVNSMDRTYNDIGVVTRIVSHGGYYVNFNSAKIWKETDWIYHKSSLELVDDSTWGSYIQSDTIRVDPVNHPSHYCVGDMEVIDIIENFELNYRLGNCIKYILRAGRKNDRLEDLKKAEWYLKREIEKCSI